MFNRILNYGKSLGNLNPFPRIWKKAERNISVLSFGRRGLSGLHELIESLERIMGNIEPRFLQLGQELQDLYSDAGNLAQLTMTAAASIGGKEDRESFLSNIDRVVKQSLADLQGYHYGIRDSLKNADSSLEYLGKLVAICSVIEKTGMSLNVIGLNIAVESSRSAESGEMFSVFTEEIRQLSRKVSGISQNILNDAESTRLNQISSHANILKGLELFARVYEDAEKIVQGAVSDIFEIMELSIKIFGRSNLLLQEISRQVGEVVVGIQFHDIARQKIEHIVLALRDVEKLCMGEGEETKKQELLGRAYKILKLQKSQLNEVVMEIRGAYEKCSHAFESLAHQVGELVADVSVFEVNDKTESRLRKRINTLKSGLKQLQGLLGQGRELESQIKGTAEHVSDAASKLSNHIDQVRGISMELHLKALNAVVKSARLHEEGRALEILAQEVSKLSRQSDAFVTDVVEILQSLLSVSLDMDLGSFDFSENDNKNDVDAGINDLTLNYEQFTNEAARALKNSHDLQSEILKNGGSLTFMTNLADELSLYLKQLDKMINTLEPWSAYADENVKDKMEQVARRYTMASERRLHKKHLDQSLAVLSSEEKKNLDNFFDKKSLETSSSDDKNIKRKDDFGDNIELFGPDDFSEYTASKTGSGKSSKKNMDDIEDNIELFGPDDFSEYTPLKTSDDKTSKKDEDKDDLGDNIELF